VRFPQRASKVLQIGELCCLERRSWEPLSTTEVLDGLVTRATPETAGTTVSRVLAQPHGEFGDRSSDERPRRVENLATCYGTD